MSLAATLWVKLALDSSEYSKGVEKSAKSTEKITKTVEKAGDEVETLSKKLIKTGSSAQRFSSEADRMKSSLTGYMKRFEAAREVTDDLGKALDFADGKIKDLSQLTGEAAQKQGILQKGLGGVAKGLLGVATAFAIGRAITGFIKDSVAAARAAGEEAEELDALSSNWDRLKKGAGRVILEVVSPGVEVAANAIGFLADQMEVANTSAERFAEVGIEKVTLSMGQSPLGEKSPFFTEVVVLFDEATGAAIDFSDALEAIEVDDEAAKRIQEINDAFSDTDAVEDATEQWRKFAAQTRAFDSGNLDTFFDQFNEEVEVAVSGLDKFQQSFSDFEGEAIIAGIKFEAAGGAELLDIEQQILDALEGGLILPVKAIELLEDLEVEKQALEIELGLKDEDQAAADLAKVLEVPIEDAQKRLDEFAAGIDQIGKTTVSDFIDDTQLEGADDKMTNLIKNLETLDGKTYTARVDIVITEKDSPVDEELAHGGDFIVPPGFPNDSFRIGVETGERVQVTPAGETATGAGGRNVSIGTQNFHGIDVDEWERQAEDARFTA